MSTVGAFATLLLALADAEAEAGSLLGDVNGRSAECSEASDCTEAAVIGLRAEFAATDA